MPELPEVETVMRGIAPVLDGAVIKKVEVHRDTLRWPIPADLAAQLEGKRVSALRRRAKYILVDIEDAPTLLIHLGMSGRIQVYGPGQTRPERQKHDHILLQTESGGTLIYNDPRRFGAWLLIDDESHPLLAPLGPEPLGNKFDATVLRSGLTGKRTPIKSALLDQHLVAGLGNIYVCEALFRAGIRPTRRADKVKVKEMEPLAAAIRAVLREAIASGGSSLRDHVQVNGELGYFQHNFDVYGRDGEVCKNTGCGQKIKRLVQSGRSSFFCPGCQP